MAKTLQELTYGYVQAVLNADDQDLRDCLDHLIVTVSRDNWLEADNRQRALLDTVRHALIMDWKWREKRH